MAATVSSELFAMTYGSLVVQLIKDLEDIEAVNAQLEKMGHNIGVRLIEEFLARGNVPDLAQRKRDPKELAEIVAKKGFRMFLGVEAKVTSWANNNTECSFILDENPLLEFVELPDEYAGLQYANIICGALRGALEQIQVRVECRYVRSVLRRGDEYDEIRVVFRGSIDDTVPKEDD